MKLSVTIISIFFCSIAIGQRTKIPVGLFGRSDCINESAGCANWLLMPDSTFYFFHIAEGSQLKRIGKGKVTRYDGKKISLVYDQDFGVPNRLQLTYQSSTNVNIDSLFFDIEVRKADSSKYDPAHPLLVFLKDKFIGSCDSEGKLKVALKKQVTGYDTYLEIGKGEDMGIAVIKVFIHPNTSNHTIRAIVPGYDPLAPVIEGALLPWDKPAKAATYTFNICPSKCSVRSASLEPKSASANATIDALEQIKTKQPYLSKDSDAIIAGIRAFKP